MNVNKSKSRSIKDEAMAARMKKDQVCRTTQVCPVCYKIVSCESWKSAYKHVCRG